LIVSFIPYHADGVAVNDCETVDPSGKYVIVYGFPHRDAICFLKKSCMICAAIVVLVVLGLGLIAYVLSSCEYTYTVATPQKVK